jgi:carbon storage regulator
MLVIGRRDGERILIGPDIEVVLVRSRSGEARLGIEAPDHVVILREELENEDKEEVDRGSKKGAPIG